MNKLTDLERSAIDKSEFAAFEQKRLRGTGYDMMHARDAGVGWIQPGYCDGKQVMLEWHVDYKEDEEWPEGTFRNTLPKDKFRLRVGNEEAVIDKEAFQKLFRWC